MLGRDSHALAIVQVRIPLERAFEEVSAVHLLSWLNLLFFSISLPQPLTDRPTNYQPRDVSCQVSRWCCSFRFALYPPFVYIFFWLGFAIEMSKLIDCIRTRSIELRVSDPLSQCSLRSPETWRVSLRLSQFGMQFGDSWTFFERASIHLQGRTDELQVSWHPFLCLACQNQYNGIASANSPSTLDMMGSLGSMDMFWWIKESQSAAHGDAAKLVGDFAMPSLPRGAGYIQQAHRKYVFITACSNLGLNMANFSLLVQLSCPSAFNSRTHLPLCKNPRVTASFRSGRIWQSAGHEHFAKWLWWEGSPMHFSAWHNVLVTDQVHVFF